MANLNPRMMCTAIARIAGQVKARNVNGGTSYSIPAIIDRNYVDRSGQRPSDYLFFEYYLRSGNKPGVFAVGQDGDYMYLRKGNLVQINFEVHSFQRFDNQGNKIGIGMQLQVVPGGITLLASSRKNMPNSTQAQPKTNVQASQPQVDNNTNQSQVNNNVNQTQNNNVTEPTVVKPTIATEPKAPEIKVDVPQNSQTVKPQQPKEPAQNTTPANLDPNQITDDDLPF